MSKELTTIGALSAIQQMFASDKDTRNQALATIRESPAMALAVIADRGTALSLPQRARALDEIIGEIPDAAQAQALVAEHFHPDHLKELLAIRGGLPSSTNYSLDRNALIGAMLHDAENAGNSDTVRALIVLSWAHVLKDREDWSEFLEATPTDDEDELSIGDLLLLGIWFSRDRSGQDLDDLEESEFVDLGFDEPEDTRKRLKQLLRERETVSIKVQALRLQLSERQKQRQTTDDKVADQTVEAAEAADVDVDL